MERRGPLFGFPKDEMEKFIGQRVKAVLCDTQFHLTLIFDNLAALDLKQIMIGPRGRAAWHLMSGHADPMPDSAFKAIEPEDPRFAALIGMTLTSATGDALLFDFTYGLELQSIGIMPIRHQDAANRPQHSKLKH